MLLDVWELKSLQKVSCLRILNRLKVSEAKSFFLGLDASFGRVLRMPSYLETFGKRICRLRFSSLAIRSMDHEINWLLSNGASDVELSITSY